MDAPNNPVRSELSAEPAGPSSFYGVRLWNFTIAMARILPHWALKLICLTVAEVYRWINPKRHQIVIRNLEPVFEGNERAARKAAHKLYRRFALKLVDLWRFESGIPVTDWALDEQNLEILDHARKRGKGVLVITPHLGNWELGAPLLASRGIKLLVITQPEPEHELTEVRKASRARWGIETLVIGKDDFAFLEVIKRLHDGAVIALLIDRPPPPTGVTVELFGQPFLASKSAAELARATGCALLGVSIVQTPRGYAPHFLPEFTYDRRALGNHEARRQFTARIMRAFEPVIRQNPDQWYHFVPVWPDIEKRS